MALKMASKITLFAVVQLVLWNVSFYNVFVWFPSELFVLHYVFACQFQTGQFLQCFWGEAAATCFLQWVWRSFYSTEKLSFTESFSCFCDLYVLKCSFYNSFLIVFVKRIFELPLLHYVSCILIDRNFWNVNFTQCFYVFHFLNNKICTIYTSFCSFAISTCQLYTMFLCFPLFA